MQDSGWVAELDTDKVTLILLTKKAISEKVNERLVLQALIDDLTDAEEINLHFVL